jgi:digeranylgeranylglycerophospholipid reductase
LNNQRGLLIIQGGEWRGLEFRMNRDVAIVGGSAAGFFTAYLLANHGIKPRVFEAANNIGSPHRTLIVTHCMHDMLGTLGESAVVNKIHQFELFADGHIATISLRRPDLIIERSILVKALAAKAVTAGTQIITGMRFLTVEPNGKKLTLTLVRKVDGKSVEVSTDMLIGADGAFSKVAQDAGWPAQQTAHLIQALVDLPSDMSPHTARVWFIPEKTPYFFWLIPHSPTQGVLGLIGGEARDTRQALMHFSERKGLEPIGFQSARIPLYSKWALNHRKIGKNHVYLVGDAAGHVKSSTVGGIVVGFRGARGVAEAILDGGSSRELKTLRWELDRHKLIRKTLNRFTQMDYVTLLKLLSRSNKRSLSSLSRDETSKLLAHLFLKNPRLLLLGLRSLLSGN